MATPSRVTIVLVCGLPGAGKTTLVRSPATSGHGFASATAAIDAAEQTPTPPLFCGARVEVLCFDDMFAAESSGAAAFDPLGWKRTQERMIDHAQRRILAHHTAPSPGGGRLVLFIDDNFPLRSQRKRFFRLAQDARCGFGVLYVDTPPDVCASRNRQRTGRARVPDDVWQRMADAFEPPDVALHHDANTVFLSHVLEKEPRDTALVAAMDRLVARGDQLSVEYARLQEQRALAEHHRDLDRQQTQACFLHSVDLSLRRWISSVLQDENEWGGTTKAALAQRLNQQRKALLTRLKRRLPNGVDSCVGETPDDAVMNFVAACTTLQQHDA
ncbi:hypothetical protein ATCC90586_001062 [Pythium insidiosum]|nr:hypothetical protein ATCC90586_001062 [Pythium insidiosum]